MKLPVLDSTSYLPAQLHALVTAHASAQGIVPQGIFDTIVDGVKSVVNGAIDRAPCVLAKAGPKGLGCLLTCGPNPVCLAACGGVSLGISVLQCL